MPHRGDYERDVAHREAPAYGVDRIPDAFQQIGQLALRNGAAARLQRVQPLITRVGLGPLEPPLLRFIERASRPPGEKFDRKGAFSYVRQGG